MSRSKIFIFSVVLLGTVTILTSYYVWERLKIHGWAGAYYRISSLFLGDAISKDRSEINYLEGNTALLSKSIGYNEKCANTASLVVGDTGHAKYIYSPNTITIGEIHRFVKYKYWFKNFYHDYVYRMFKKEQGMYIGYLKFEDEYHDITKFEIAKIIPPTTPFNQLGYYNLTMGSLGIIPDLTGDGIPELITKTSQEECSPDRIDVLISGQRLQHHLRHGVNRFVLGDDSINLNSYRYKDEAIDDTTNVNAFKASSECQILLHNGRPLSLIKNGTQVVAHKFLHPVPSNAVLIKNRILYLERTDKDKVRAIEIDCLKGDTVPTDLPIAVVDQIEIKDIHKLSYSFSKDIDGDGIEEFSFHYKNYLYILPSKTKMLVSIKFPTKFKNYNLGNISHFGGNIKLRNKEGSDIFLNTITFSDARHEDYPGGAVFLLDLSRVRGALQEIESVLFSSILGTQIHVMNTANNGIGYSLSPVSADFDKDGVEDLITVSHYEGAFNGALYILSGRHIASGSIFQTSDPDFVKIRGVPNSFLGTGLDVSFDWDDDGVNDVVVGADVDHEAALGAGAIHILSGRLIGRHLQAEEPKSKLQ